jgi:uncharacterized protein (TIGR00375 family)
MTPETLWRWAQMKGITVVGTGDFTHPQWFAELTRKLDPLGNGLFVLRDGYRTVPVVPSCRADICFLLSAEISCIYSKGGRTRKVHCLLFAPDFESAARVGLLLSRIGNVTSDGRPILGLDAKDLLRLSLDANPDGFFVPAHAWTPHFSVFGAASGFDTLEECFEDLSPHVHAIETGLSSDPAMNWRLSRLDTINLISNSDAHSPAKMGRESTVLEADLSFQGIKGAIEGRGGLMGTVEFFPEEGKYHWDGHRSCKAALPPADTIRNGYRCPVCGKPVTVGVMHRVEKLADRREGIQPPGAPWYRSIIPLVEIIAEAKGVGAGSKGVGLEYMALLSKLGNEFSILMDASPADIEAASSPLVSEAVMRMRRGEVVIAPGYDGEYGRIRIFDEAERSQAKGQMRLL